MNNENRYRIMIETTNICNAKCEFCANATLKREKMVMSDEIFNLIVERIEDENINVEQFILHLNGEPFTDSKLIKRIRLLKEKYENVPIRFATNFSLPDENTIDDLLESGLDSITISMNAITEESYRAIMGLNYRKTLKNLEYLLEKKREKHHNIEICLSIVDLGNIEDINQFEKKYSSVADVRIMHLGKWIGKEKHEKLLENRNNYGKCPDLWQQICILSNGDFAICSFDCEGHIGINIKNTPILKAFYSDSYEKLRKHQIKFGRKGSICENCSFSY